MQTPTDEKERTKQAKKKEKKKYLAPTEEIKLQRKNK